MDNLPLPGNEAISPGEMPMGLGLSPEPIDWNQVSNSENLLDRLPADFVQKLGQRIIKRTESAWKSGEEYRKKLVRHLRLFMGDPPGKAPEEGFLYINMPYLTKVALAFHAKMHKASFPVIGDLCGVNIDRPNTSQVEYAMSRHLNLVLRNRVPEYIPAHDRSGLQRLLFGSRFSIFFWDPTLKRPVYETATPDEIVVPYTTKSDREDMSDVPYFTWIRYHSRDEFEAHAEAGWYAKTAMAKIFPEVYGEDGLPSSTTGNDDHTIKTTLSEEGDKLMGVKRPESGGEEVSEERRQKWEHDCNVKFPGAPKALPCTVHIDAPTSVVLRINLRQRIDPVDGDRFMREEQLRQEQMTAAMVQFQAANQAYQGAMASHQIGQTLLANGSIQPWEAPSHPGQPPAPPVEPPPTPPPLMVPIHRVTHDVCIPNPAGFYGLSLAYLVEGHQMAANEVMTNFATLLRAHLSPGGVYSRHAKMKRGEVRFKVGKMIELDVPPDQLDKVFKLIQYPNPDPNTFKLEERQSRAVQEITADDVIIGGQGLSGQTATESNLRASNAMTGISEIAARSFRARSNEIKCLARILAETLPDQGETFYVKEEDQELVVTRKMYLERFEVTFTADPNLASRPQQQQDALTLLNTAERIFNLNTGGVGLIDSTTGVMLLRAVAAQVMKSLEHPEIARAIMQAPPPQMTQEPSGPSAGPSIPGTTPQGDPNATGPNKPNGASLGGLASPSGDERPAGEAGPRPQSVPAQNP